MLARKSCTGAAGSVRSDRDDVEALADEVAEIGALA